MLIMAKALIGGLALSILLPLWYYTPSDIVIIPEETVWCPENHEQIHKPFRIAFTEDMVEDLKYRLNHTRKIAEPLTGTGWTYGVSGKNFKNIINYWLNKYDFKTREQYLNKYPQFITTIQGLNIHYLHVKPEKAVNKKIVPLMLIHGWPGSVVEFYKIIPMLTTPRADRDFVFEVVVPSLPGFGFSSAATIPGLGASQMAVVFKNLMIRLGYKTWYVQGGDWGAGISADMAALYPEHIRAVHSNMCIVMSGWSTFKTILYSVVPSLITTKETYPLMYPLKKHWGLLLKESGYFHIQATRPDTIGVGLNDSPAGLAAYILEKFARWTKDDSLQKPDQVSETFQIDELLDNLMMYWVPQSSTTAARIYAQTMNAGNEISRMAVKVPSFCAQFPNEISYQPPEILKERYRDLRRAKLMPRGGHFAAFEQPQLLADDIWESIAEIENPTQAT